MKNFWAFICAVAVIFLASASVIAIYKQANREGLAKVAAQKALVESLSGYPAPESEITSGKFYSCEAAIQESWPGRTNCFVVLQEMIPNGKYWKIVLGQKRLFQVKNPVGRSTLIYRAERTNGVTSLTPVGASPSPEFQIEKPIFQPPKATPKVNDTEA